MKPSATAYRIADWLLAAFFLGVIVGLAVGWLLR